MRLQMTQHAGPDTVFAQGAFDSQIGKRMPFRVDGVDYGEGTLVAAEVSQDGCTAELTFEVPAAVPELDAISGGPMSFRFRA